MSGIHLVYMIPLVSSLRKITITMPPLVIIVWVGVTFIDRVLPIVGFEPIPMMLPV